MAHETPLDVCAEKWKSVDNHLKESVSVRSVVDKSGQQILTLEKAHEQTMEDIKGIYEKLTEISITVQGSFNKLQIWILTAAIMGLMTVIGGLMYFSGQMKQLEINTKEINEIREIFKPAMKDVAEKMINK